jgi:hypothetical protein
MSSAKELVRRLRSVASQVKSAATWNGSLLPVDATKNDYIYELYCFFRLATAASPHFCIRVSGTIDIAGTGKRAAKWPKKPANKKNYSYLSLQESRSKNEVFQLCPGIKINDIHGKARAPDLNLLIAGAPEEPGHADVVSMWDAKFTSKQGSRLPDTAVSDFLFTYRQLGSPKAVTDWVLMVKEVEWRESGLLTNGLASTEKDATFAAYGVSETSGFPDGPAKTRP